MSSGGKRAGAGRPAGPPLHQAKVGLELARMPEVRERAAEFGGLSGYVRALVGADLDGREVPETVRRGPELRQVASELFDLVEAAAVLERDLSIVQRKLAQLLKGLP